MWAACRASGKSSHWITCTFHPASSGESPRCCTHSQSFTLFWENLKQKPNESFLVRKSFFFLSFEFFFFFHVRQLWMDCHWKSGFDLWQLKPVCQVCKKNIRAASTAVVQTCFRREKQEFSFLQSCLCMIWVNTEKHTPFIYLYRSKPVLITFCVLCKLTISIVMCFDNDLKVICKIQRFIVRVVHITNMWFQSPAKRGRDGEGRREGAGSFTDSACDLLAVCGAQCKDLHPAAFVCSRCGLGKRVGKSRCSQTTTNNKKELISRYPPKKTKNKKRAALAWLVKDV